MSYEFAAGGLPIGPDSASPARFDEVALRQYEMMVAAGYDVPDELRQRVHGTGLAGLLAEHTNTFTARAVFGIRDLRVCASVDETVNPWPPEASNERVPHATAMVGWLILNNPDRGFRPTTLNAFLLLGKRPDIVRLRDGPGAWLQRLRVINEPLIMTQKTDAVNYTFNVNPALRVEASATEAWYDVVGSDLLALNKRRSKAHQLYLGERLTPELSPQ